MKVLKRKALIVQGTTTPKQSREMWERFGNFAKMYEQVGPCRIGDKLKPETQIEVKQGETAFEVFSAEAAAWVRNQFPEVREVETRWYPDL